jgi:hypothetical protein
VGFVVSDFKHDKDTSLYRPLLSYGYQIFALCVTTLLVGTDLAVKAGLEEKFVSNQERFKQVCVILDDETASPSERLRNFAKLVDAIERNKFLEKPHFHRKKVS